MRIAPERIEDAAKELYVRALKDLPPDIKRGFATLAAKQITFARFCATGFWPADMKLYQENRTEYFRRLDAEILLRGGIEDFLRQ